MFAINKLKEFQYDLSKNKDVLGLSWKDISDSIYKEFGVRLSKDYIRHEYYALKSNAMVEEKDVDTKILVLSDNHYPFNLPLDFLEMYKDKIDVLIFNGDEQDCQSISKFQKTHRIPFTKELIGTRQMLIDAIKTVNPKKVMFTKGNHNMRLIRYMSNKLDSDVLGLIPETNLDYIVNGGFRIYDHEEETEMFYAPLKEVFKDKEIVYDRKWHCMVGKTIFCHPEAYRSTILGTTEKAWQYFNQKNYNFDTLVVAHTHQLGYTRYGAYNLFESGCMCKEMNYSEGRLIKPQAKGYLYLCQDKEGNLLFDKSKIIHL